ncbi:hypothetical protein BX616_002182 [Lobosporangium transversale]|uniref:Beta-lactamase/transpeptidase-like protein n=1 Tax=Lobosporangium transversale TaxID=64571 RepID=A0A1Y2GWZ1_9FUNG|nr:beta-lactamase/transpeptidase-like protein [Lobosporangium transversale]KAF9901681.1 hypothetical protein BX616_002182 [Lobosporangium transversale]ORZ21867.1 beta-lactamase/transpeptidase-like protein [Lobosporangium transversale]|eukprot:XP_021883118.1 beta-lactamase/transpeptidase-like protein [Lobosporangium transversale]
MVAFSPKRLRSFLSVAIPTILVLLSPSAVTAQDEDLGDNRVSAPASLSNLRSVIEKARVESGIPGMSVAVLYKGKLVFAEGFGKRNAKDPFEPETLMPMGSITKSFTAAAIGELVAEGKMDWDQTPVSKYLPEFEVDDPVLTSELTAVDLLSHRTGMLRHDAAWLKANITRLDLIKRIKYDKLDRKLKTKAVYNNIMYAAIGEASARVAGTSWEKLVENKVVKPLGLKNTGFGPMAMKKRSSNHAIPSFAWSFEDAVKGKFEYGELSPIYLSVAPAGDMYSNVLDLTRYGQVIMNGGKSKDKQVLNKDSIREVCSGHTFFSNQRLTADFAPTQAYGMGWLIDSYKGKTFLSHDGSISSFISNLQFFPNDDLVVATQSNGLQASGLVGYLPFLIADELFGLPKTEDWLALSVAQSKGFYDYIAYQLNGGDLPPLVKSKPTTRPLSDFTGKYTHPIYGEMTVELRPVDGKEDALFITFNKLESKMEHYHYDSFKMAFVDDGAATGVFLTFEQGSDGGVSGFQAKMPEGWKQFTKTK